MPEKRQIMTDYLVNKTGSPASTFSNFYTNSLAMMIKALLNGKNAKRSENRCCCPGSGFRRC